MTAGFLPGSRQFKANPAILAAFIQKSASSRIILISSSFPTISGVPELNSSYLPLVQHVAVPQIASVYAASRPTPPQNFS